MKLETIKNSVSEKNIQKLAENLRFLLKKNHLTATRLAHALGIPMMTIRRLLSGETTDPRISTLKLLADYFDTSIDALVNTSTNSQLTTHSLKKTTSYLLPKLSWDTAEKIDNIQALDLSTWLSWQSVFLSEQDKLSKNAFALTSRPSMYPRFPQGSVFIIDPETLPADGDMVLIRWKENKELTLRELVIDPPEWQLHPVIVGSTVFHYSTQNHEIVGVNLLTMLYNRKSIID